MFPKPSLTTANIAERLYRIVMPILTTARSIDSPYSLAVLTTANPVERL